MNVGRVLKVSIAAWVLTGTCIVLTGIARLLGLVETHRARSITNALTLVLCGLQAVYTVLVSMVLGWLIQQSETSDDEESWSGAGFQ
jgi:hypothetical protein